LTLISVENDAWNGTSDGASCISVSPNVDSFNATWFWPTGKDNTHSFPHINFMPKNLPAPLSNITAMVLAADWTVDSTTWIGNVALDMFADADVTNSTNAQKAAYELMVWFGDYGNPWPLGYADGIKATETVNNVV
jgi:xyloglucan-specific endo-beta-1,4-glucanase